MRNFNPMKNLNLDAKQTTSHRGKTNAFQPRRLGVAALQTRHDQRGRHRGTTGDDGHITAGLVYATNLDTARIFLTVTLISMVYTARPKRENNGDWFLNDLTQHYGSKAAKTSLTVVRKIYAIIGLVLFIFLLSKGWRYMLFRVDTALLAGIGVLQSISLKEPCCYWENG